jgi:ribosomal protein S17E
MIIILLSGSEIDTKQDNWCDLLTDQILGWRLKSYSENIDQDLSLKNEIANIADQIIDSNSDELRNVIAGLLLNLIRNKLSSLKK